ncbi:MAG: 50S ribosomal protein L23 [Holosporales bacterium]|jgi:large subunit ribosomal protein L23|nr:50S ribosomal protein L23 [Holosporales bacterium]
MVDNKHSSRTNFSDYCILRGPVVSEKIASFSDKNQYCLLVDLRASKLEVKRAVERVFDVTVVSVQTIVRKGKKRVFKGRRARLSDEKRAIVRLAAGQNIVFEGV